MKSKMIVYEGDVKGVAPTVDWRMRLRRCHDAVCCLLPLAAQSRASVSVRVRVFMPPPAKNPSV